jgi:casein kinase 1
MKLFTNVLAEEFNKYLSYVRNLGFEDTPDYDYLRELFTQALKSTGEVEDGEYDWMKLNNGKGWEVLKAHPSAVHHLQNSGAHQNSSTAVNVHGQAHRHQKTHLPVGHQRLDADLPKPGATRGPPGKTPRDMQQAKYAHADAVKRKSTGELAPPEGSTQAQFQHSQPNLGSTQRAPAASPNVASPQRGAQQNTEKPGFFKKLASVLCCSGGNA